MLDQNITPCIHRDRSKRKREVDGSDDDNGKCNKVVKENENLRFTSTISNTSTSSSDTLSASSFSENSLDVTTSSSRKHDHFQLASAKSGNDCTTKPVVKTLETTQNDSLRLTLEDLSEDNTCLIFSFAYGMTVNALLMELFVTMSHVSKGWRKMIQYYFRNYGPLKFDCRYLGTNHKLYILFMTRNKMKLGEICYHIDEDYHQRFDRYKRGRYTDHDVIRAISERRNDLLLLLRECDISSLRYFSLNFGTSRERLKQDSVEVQEQHSIWMNTGVKPSDSSTITTDEDDGDHPHRYLSNEHFQQGINSLLMIKDRPNTIKSLHLIFLQGSMRDPFLFENQNIAHNLEELSIQERRSNMRYSSSSNHTQEALKLQQSVSDMVERKLKCLKQLTLSLSVPLKIIRSNSIEILDLRDDLMITKESLLLCPALKRLKINIDMHRFSEYKFLLQKCSSTVVELEITLCYKFRQPNSNINTVGATYESEESSFQTLSQVIRAMPNLKVIAIIASDRSSSKVIITSNSIEEINMSRGGLHSVKCNCPSLKVFVLASGRISSQFLKNI